MSDTDKSAAAAGRTLTRMGDEQFDRLAFFDSHGRPDHDRALYAEARRARTEDAALHAEVERLQSNSEDYLRDIETLREEVKRLKKSEAALIEQHGALRSAECIRLDCFESWAGHHPLCSLRPPSSSPAQTTQRCSEFDSRGGRCLLDLGHAVDHYFPGDLDRLAQRIAQTLHLFAQGGAAAALAPEKGQAGNEKKK